MDKLATFDLMWPFMLDPQAGAYPGNGQLYEMNGHVVSHAFLGLRQRRFKTAIEYKDRIQEGRNPRTEGENSWTAGEQAGHLDMVVKQTD